MRAAACGGGRHDQEQVLRALEIQHLQSDKLRREMENTRRPRHHPDVPGGLDGLRGQRRDGVFTTGIILNPKQNPK